jgi:hypothetical protein
LERTPYSALRAGVCTRQQFRLWGTAKAGANVTVNPIREFEVRSVFTALHPIGKATGYWKDRDYTGYSAIAFETEEKHK